AGFRRGPRGDHPRTVGPAAGPRTPRRRCGQQAGPGALAGGAPMSRGIVVGSGASGIHFAVTALERGHEVVLLDVAQEPRAPVARSEDSLETLKETLPDPARYFLGEDFGSVLFPDTDVEYYGFPPHRDYIFE